VARAQLNKLQSEETCLMKNEGAARPERSGIAPGASERQGVRNFISRGVNVHNRNRVACVAAATGIR